MGTRYAAVFYGSHAPRGLAEALSRAVTEVDEQMSTWKPESDLMRFNRAPPGEWVMVPDRLMHVVEAGLAIGRLTAGAFDIGVLDLVSAWGFNRRDGTPNAVDVESLAGKVRLPAHELVELDPGGGRMCKTRPVTLDLSGIAKGYGVDRLAETMHEFGIGDYLVSIDGEVRARGRKADGSPWRVALEAPIPGRREIAGFVELDDAALATSGDYRHRVTLDGKTYAHTMDLRTGRPLDNRIQAVTVRAPSCMHADAWATAVMVAGKSALPLVRSLGMEAIIALPADND
jgi:thiamine biosynthesis lipoprotein